MFSSPVSSILNAVPSSSNELIFPFTFISPDVGTTTPVTIFNNVDFQLLLTQILHLNLKRVKIASNDMEYLDKVLGVKVTYDDVEFKHLPNFIATRYRLRMVSMIEQKMIFLYPKTELEQIEVLKKHIARIQKNENLPVVLVLKELSFRQKEYLIREKIPFIVDGKQIYLPFMAVYLQERCSAEKKTREEILPSAQMLLLHFIYGGAQELSTSQAAKNLELTPTSISRASKQLEEMGLLHIKKEGVPQFYRFSHPITNQYPAMIELFMRKLDAIQLPEDADERVEEAMEECRRNCGGIGSCQKMSI